MSDFRSKTNLIDRRCLDEPVKEPCKDGKHFWEPIDAGRKVQCLDCKEVRIAGVAPLHHRSCHLRKGGNDCTC